MLAAVSLAAKHKFLTRPNPCVGALLVRDGLILARGAHKGAGLPHAEIEALEDARQKGVDPASCTLVVTLEPCRHQGRTPPCTNALLASGIKKVVIGALDPNPEASGGAQILREHGLSVETGVAEDKCLDLIDDFITWQTTDLPYTLLKLASTLDGRIATRTGHSKWISSVESRAYTHKLRQRVQAVLVGGNTFYQDNPRLDARANLQEETEAEGDQGSFEQPLAVVVTSRLPDAEQSLHLLQDSTARAVFWTTAAAAASPKAESLRRKGVSILGLPSRILDPEHGPGMRAALDLRAGLVWLRKNLGCHYILCEGGGRLGLSLLDKGLIREFILHLAPKILGDNEAVPLFNGLAPLNIDQSLKLRITQSAPLGPDMMLVMRPERIGEQNSTSCR
ncbi:MAG: bifunctional diaminohydroxyphosphoribosylaminopyrimidine deaminase/5-amino-6-(5-phosphoribosylamino)uracil reductase RibD [Desulfovibrio sp.]|jgi:diaminohydroxyphosphoribosylaminopyrimidine deaminase/5-amino-6-(5-phosphoribosylamino)uracil reductase|nr:bifunctional diaminohydroxyphosphoribosylaminopyrimidine deaminase/5-amino-6-(5-phosphoribosylamino)uracil reductase RibD [Desulfovibrio sp.]